ncbi:MAG TPA: hypothetical protein VGL56_06055 [Fimbriimonadaceae bacterium]
MRLVLLVAFAAMIGAGCGSTDSAGPAKPDPQKLAVAKPSADNSHKANVGLMQPKMMSPQQGSATPLVAGSK